MRITIVDNDRALLRSLEILLGAEGHEVCCFAEPGLALESLGTLPADAWPELLLVDYMMPGMTGIDLLGALRMARPSDCTCVVITAHADQISQSALRDLGVETVLAKPLGLSALRSHIQVNTEEKNARS